MAALAGPFEILDLQDGEVAQFRVLRVETGDVPITPTRTRVTEIVPATRLHLPPGAKRTGLPYWDVTSKTLQAQLAGVDAGGGLVGRTVRITAFGVQPRKRFQLEVLP